MATTFAPKTIGALAPLVLVLTYYVAVAAFPGVDLRQLFGLTLSYMGVVCSILLIVSLAAFALLLTTRLLKRDIAESPLDLARGIVRKHWESDRGLGFLVSALVLAFLLPSFNAFKQSILPYAGFGLDPLFARWDRALFLGVDPWRVTHAILPGAEGSWWISFLYHPLYFPMVVGIALCAILPVRATLRTQYLLCFALVWILIGSALAFLLPSAGPVYYGQFHAGPDPFAPLLDTLAGQDRTLFAAGSALDSVHYQRALGLAFGVPKLEIGRGISAMPSVHIALAALFACGAFAFRTWLGWIFTVYGVVIWLASIHLGWHYAVDGLVSSAIVWPMWVLCGLAARRLHRAPEWTPAVCLEPQ